MSEFHLKIVTYITSALAYHTGKIYSFKVFHVVYELVEEKNDACVLFIIFVMFSRISQELASLIDVPPKFLLGYNDHLLVRLESLML
jgi:hypothetical protein